MLCNIFEWCWEIYADYPKITQIDTTRPEYDKPATMRTVQADFDSKIDRNLERVLRGVCYRHFLLTLDLQQGDVKL
jgi:hypothetical protein